MNTDIENLLRQSGTGKLTDGIENTAREIQTLSNLLALAAENTSFDVSEDNLATAAWMISGRAKDISKMIQALHEEIHHPDPVSP